MKRSLLLASASLLLACQAGGGSASFTPEHANALRDSVSTFLDEYAREVSEPPYGTPAREALARIYTPGVVMSSDLAGDAPVLLQGIDSVAPADEIVRKIPGISTTKFVWERRVVTPVAPGVAVFTGIYAEHVTDTTGTTTILPGVQQGLVRHGPSGWRLETIQGAHPQVTHQRQAEIGKRLAGAGGK